MNLFVPKNVDASVKPTLLYFETLEKLHESLKRYILRNPEGAQVAQDLLVAMQDVELWFSRIVNTGSACLDAYVRYVSEYDGVQEWTVSVCIEDEIAPIMLRTTAQGEVSIAYEATIQLRFKRLESGSRYLWSANAEMMRKGRAIDIHHQRTSPNIFKG